MLQPEITGVGGKVTIYQTEGGIKSSLKHVIIDSLFQLGYFSAKPLYHSRKTTIAFCGLHVLQVVCDAPRHPRLLCEVVLLDSKTLVVSNTRCQILLS